jgi:SSS family transporter
MQWLAEHWLTLLFVAGFLAILTWHAIQGQRQVNSLSDYLVAGRNLGGWLVALSFYATFMSTNTFIGAAGKSYEVGMIWCLGIVVYLALCCFSWFVVAPRFVPLARKYNSLTVADFLGCHYDSIALRRVAAVIIAFASIIYLVAIYKGSALALSGMLELRYETAIILIFLVVTAYTLAGGFRSVVLTDAVQGVLMLCGAVGIAVAMLVKGGGLGTMLKTIQEKDPQLLSWSGHMPILMILGIQLAVALKYVVEPKQLSRFYGLRNPRALKQAAMIAPLIILLTYVCLLPAGVLAHAVDMPGNAIVNAAGEVDTDKVIPELILKAQLFGPALSSLFLLVLLSAAMSSIDSVLLVAASAIDHDLISPNRTAADAAAVKRTRLWVVVVSLASASAALSPLAGDIMSLTSLSGSFYAACFLPALVVGLFLKRVSVQAALASMILGIITVLCWYVARRLQMVSLHEIYPGLAEGLAVYLLVTLLLGDKMKEAGSGS